MMVDSFFFVFFFLLVGHWLWFWQWWLSQVSNNPHVLVLFVCTWMVYKWSHTICHVFYSFVHGRLPYEKLKPDHVLRSLLLSLPIRKVVSCFTFNLNTSRQTCLQIKLPLVTMFWFFMQIFSNADKAHVATVLRKLGLEDCFDGVICFETLNPNNKSNTCDDKKEITDIIDHPCQSNPDSVVLPKTTVVCKPFEEAFEMAFKLANISPQRTVSGLKAKSPSN